MSDSDINHRIESAERLARIETKQDDILCEIKKLASRNDAKFREHTMRMDKHDGRIRGVELVQSRHAERIGIIAAIQTVVSSAIAAAVGWISS